MTRFLRTSLVILVACGAWPTPAPADPPAPTASDAKASAEPPTPPPVTATIQIDGDAPTEVVVPFGRGETERYALAWVAIGAGEMKLTATPPETATPETYTLRLDATSNDFFSRFFYVEDSLVSRVEKRHFESMRYEKHTREGKRVKDEVSVFDLDRRFTIHKGNRIELPDHILDTLSAVYFLRLLPLKTGASFTFEAYSNGKIYPLEIRVLGFEQIEVPAGTFRAWKIEPKLAEGLFKKDGQMFLWIADDPARTLVRVRTNLSFGYITASLLAPDQDAPIGEEAAPSEPDRPLESEP